LCGGCKVAYPDEYECERVKGGVVVGGCGVEGGFLLDGVFED
jgi:hypothetical protein